MTTALMIEEEHGTSSGRAHPHNGYHAGNFSGPSDAVEQTTSPRSPWLRVLS